MFVLYACFVQYSAHEYNCIIIAGVLYVIESWYLKAFCDKKMSLYSAIIAVFSIAYLRDRGPPMPSLPLKWD